MNGDQLALAKNPDLVNSLTAMHRASRMAREHAVHTDTYTVVRRDGKMVHFTAEELRREGFK